jgi:hypothetical protein
MNQIETADATPEQLVQMLDTRIAMSRARASGSGRHRATLLVGGVLFIFIVAGVALVVLAQMAADLSHGERPSTAQAATPIAGKF